jgi:hypothetical protein
MGDTGIFVKYPDQGVHFCADGLWQCITGIPKRAFSLELSIPPEPEMGVFFPVPQTLMFSTVRMNIPITKDIAAIPRLMSSISPKRLQKGRSLATDI